MAKGHGGGCGAINDYITCSKAKQHGESGDGCVVDKVVLALGRDIFGKSLVVWPTS